MNKGESETMIKRKDFMRVALSFVCVCLLFLAIPFNTYAAVTPTLSVTKVNDYVFLTNTYTQQYNITEDGNYVVPDYVIATYEGDSSLRVKLTLNEGMYYNGSGYFDFSININDSGDLDVRRIDMKIDQDANIEGISYSLTPESIGEAYTSYTVRVQFQNFCATSGTLYLPFSLNAKMVAVCDNTAGDSVAPQRTLKIELGSTGLTVSELSSPLELNDVDGFIANQNQTMIEQNQTMIDQDNTRNTLLGQIRNKIAEIGTNIVAEISEWGNSIVSTITSAKNSLIQTLNDGFNRLDQRITNQSNAEMDKMEELSGNQITNDNKNHNSLLDKIDEAVNKLMNNYQGTGTDDAADKFDDSAGELESVESSLTGITNTSINSYTDSAFDTTVIASLGSSLVYVVTWFTNFWNMGGLFSSILNTGLALSIACFILRLRGAK